MPAHAPRRSGAVALTALAALALGGRCGGGGGDPSRGTELELQAIYDLARITVPERPGGFQTYYVSSETGGDYPLGDDANPGTASAPWRSLGRVRSFLSAGTCGVEIVFDGGETWTGADLGTALYEIPLGCPGESDSIATYLRSSDPDAPVLFDCTGGTPFFGVVRATAPAGAGWLVVENLHLANCAADGFDTVAHAKMLTLNAGAVNCRVAGNQCFTPHDDSTLVALNPYALAIDQADAFVSAGNSRFVLIGRGPFVQDGTGVSALSSKSPEGFVLGTVFAAGPGATSGKTLVTVATTAPGDDHALTLIGVRAHGATGGGTNVRALASHDGSHVALRLLGVTLSSSSNGIKQEVAGAGASMDVVGRCLLLDEIEATQWYSLGTDDVERSSVDIRRSLQDEDDHPTYSFRINGSSLGIAADLAQALGQIAALDAAGRWTAFFDDPDSRDSGGIGADGIQWDGDGDPETPDAYPDQRCLPGKECWNACGIAFQEWMPVPLPAFVLGREIDWWQLQPAHLGAF